MCVFVCLCVVHTFKSHMWSHAHFKRRGSKSRDREEWCRLIHAHRVFALQFLHHQTLDSNDGDCRRGVPCEEKAIEQTIDSVSVINSHSQSANSFSHGVALLAKNIWKQKRKKATQTCKRNFGRKRLWKNWTVLSTYRSDVLCGMVIQNTYTPFHTPSLALSASVSSV